VWLPNRRSITAEQAFSTTGSVEGVNFLHTGKLVSLSEQDLVSCDPKDKGCNGGIMEDAYTV
jgi:hypothetical protein